MRAFLLFVVALAGCASPVPTPWAVDDMTMGPADGPTAALDLEGHIIGLDRQPLSGVKVSLCQETCRDTLTGTRGEFTFPGVTVSFYTLRARMPGASDFADLDFPLYLQSGAYPRLLPLVLPKVGADAPVAPGAQRFVVDQALSLALDGDTLALPQGGPVGRLGGVRIAQQELFPNFCVPSARALAMWAFTPTGVTSPSPIGVTVSESLVLELGLKPGTPVSFIEINPKDGRPGVSASGAVGQDGSIRTAMGAGLHRLSWLLMAVFQGGA